MAAGNLCVCVLLALVAGNLIMAEEEQSRFFNPFEYFTSFFGNSREKRSPSPDDHPVANGNNSDEHQTRFFLSYRVGCNATNQSRLSCLNCRTTLRCNSNNEGLARRCLFFCNNGRCSLFPGSACNFTG